MKRRFVLGALLAGTGALVVGWSVLPPRQRLSPASPLPDIKDQPAFNGWVRIGKDDSVTVVMSRSEMGQGIHTGLAMVLADELDARWDQVRIEPSPIDSIYNNQAVAADGLPFHPDSQSSVKKVAQHLTAKTMREFGLMMTGGSSGIKDLWLPMRQAGASARAMLVAAAAAQWQLPAAEIRVKEGVVSHPSGKSARLGELAALAAQQSRPDAPKLKTTDQFTLIGRSLPRLETAAKVDGSAIYSIDARLEGLLYAVVGMNPEVGGTFQIFDETQIKPIPGVTRIVTLPELYGSTTGIAVVAKSTYLSMKILRQLTVEWCPGKANNISDSHIHQAFVNAIDSSNGFTFHSVGDVDKALAHADSKLSAEYSVPYLAHAPMEPPNCTVWFKEGRAEVWVGTQIPDLARHVVAKVLGIADDKVQLHVTLLGSSFGRRLEMDFIAQAAFIAKACEGSPVQALWDRSQDLQHDFYRPACVSRFTAGLDDKGRLLAWKNASASQAVLPQILHR